MGSPRLPPNRFGPYCLQLLELMGDLCLGRNYKAINLIEQLYPYEVHRAVNSASARLASCRFSFSFSRATYRVPYLAFLLPPRWSLLG